jgi:hypothetical protein
VREQKVVYLTMTAAARRLGCSIPTVRRVAKSKGVGIVADGTRIVALAEQDLSAIEPLIHRTSGNPAWIAAGKGRNKKS